MFLANQSGSQSLELKIRCISNYDIVSTMQEACVLQVTDLDFVLLLCDRFRSLCDGNRQLQANENDEREPFAHPPSDGIVYSFGAL